jgi:hypothetical protein
MKVFTFNGITNMKSRVKGDFHTVLWEGKGEITFLDPISGQRKTK